MSNEGATWAGGPLDLSTGPDLAPSSTWVGEAPFGDSGLAG